MTADGPGLLLASAAAHRLRHRLAAAADRRLRGRQPAPTAADLNVENVRAAAAALGVEVEVVPGGFLKLVHGTESSYAYGTDFAFEPLVPYFVCGDKSLTSTLLSGHGIPVPRSRSFDASRYAEARRYFGALPKPVVTKPARGTAGGAGVTLDISTPSALRSGFARSRAYGRRVVVEEQVEGENIRVTVLDGRILGAVRRIPAHVVGDGSRSVAALIEAKNDRWRTRRPDNVLFRPIVVDAEVRRIVRNQGLSMDSVPPAGGCVPLRRVSNADQGGEIADVGDAMHDDLRELSLRAAKALGPVLCGVDLIAVDPSRPALPGSVVVNEVNTTPSLYVANAMVGGRPSTSAAEAILRHLFGLGD